MSLTQDILRGLSASQVSLKHDHAPRPAIAVEKRADALIERLEADDVAGRGAGALIVCLEEPSDHVVNIS